MFVADSLISELINTCTVNVSNDSDQKVNTDKIKDMLNKIFPKKQCTDVIYTKNTDKIFFGVYVNPSLTANDIMNIMVSDEAISIKRYAVEIDSKLFSVGLTPDELVAYILFEVSSMIDTPVVLSDLRGSIDMYQMNHDECINIDELANYAQLFIFAIKDALVKISSIRFMDIDGILSNQFINSNEDLRNSLIDAQNKVRSSVFGIGNSVKEPKLTVLSWAFDIYLNMNDMYNSALETLKDSRNYTASKLQIAEINRTIESLHRISGVIATEAAHILNEAKSNNSLFANLKRNGLRALEDDLYEFRIRVKNADTEEDAYYALKQINTRINLLEEYIYGTEGLSEYEIQKWRDVIYKYRSLREELSAKKIVNKKSYGLFFDYDKLDDID